MEEDIWEYVRVYNLMPFRFCQNLIEQYKNDTRWEKHWWYSHGEKSQYEDKELDILFSVASAELNPYISQAIDMYCKEVKELERTAIREWSTPRLNRYNTGTTMREHCDLIRRYKRDGVPVLSLVGQLNDNYEGGEFMMRGERLYLTTGDILLFPSTYIFPHEVREITQGSRWSWVSWAY